MPTNQTFTNSKHEEPKFGGTKSQEKSGLIESKLELKI
jgi:hypothetical protein